MPLNYAAFHGGKLSLSINIIIVRFYRNNIADLRVGKLERKKFEAENHFVIYLNSYC